MRLVFWNCGVAPIKGSRSERRADAVGGVIEDLVRTRPAVIALCEADAALVDALIKSLDLGTNDYRALVLDQPAGRSRWDLALLFDQRQVRHLQDRAIIARNDGLQLKAGYGVKMVTSKSLEFELFVAHWPSLLMGSGADQHRYCAQTLWDAIQTRLLEGERVVVLGDFNEEPHDEAICKHLRASRDPGFVAFYRTQRLYNPSWSLTSPTVGSAWDDFGTMYYKKSGLGTRWHTLDQAFTCHQWFDREKGWAPEIRALRPPCLMTGPRGTFDHVPIELELTR